MDGCSIFRDELAIRYPKHGHALWEPDPGGLYEAVEVGDVGFIRKGRFYRLFNALHLENTASDSDSESSNGLKYPPKLEPKNPNHRCTSTDNHNDFYSKNVTKTHEVTQAARSDDIPLKFECFGSQGALLCLPFLANYQETTALGDFGKWIIENVDDCLKIAEDLGYGIKRIEDIVLVTGRHLACSWISAAFSASHGNPQVSFTLRRSGGSGVDIEERSVSGGELKLGPRGENLSENQCIFIQGYRVARILNFWPKLRSAGSVPDMNEPPAEADFEIQVEPIGTTSEADYSEPLHVLLEYIAEQASDCDMILVHNSDLGFIDGALQSDTLIEHIRNYAPAIRRIQCELGYKSRSGAEAEIALVATLCQDIFRASREEQNPLGLKDIISGLDNKIPPPTSQGCVASQSGDLPKFTPQTVLSMDADVSNVGIPLPAVMSHKDFPDPDQTPGSSMHPSQSTFPHAAGRIFLARDQYIPAAIGKKQGAGFVLVTEASSYTGSHIVHHLLEAGYHVRGVVESEMVSYLHAAYSKYDDRFQVVGIADLNCDDLTDVFRIRYSDVHVIILASLPAVKDRIMGVAKVIVDSASSGTKHILKFARTANVRKVIYTGSFSNTLHPDDSWNPIVVTENDWNYQTADDCKKLGLHPWCMYTAAQVIAEREVWNFADANPDIDVTSILPGFSFGPYGRGQAGDLHHSGTFAWVSALLNGPPGRAPIPNAPPFSPNYVHIADVARAHVAALCVGPLEPPKRKRILVVAGYVMWSEVIVHLARVMPEIRERLPSPVCGTGPRPFKYAQFEIRNAKKMLGFEEYRSWQEAIEDAVRDMLRIESEIRDRPSLC